MCVCSSRRRHTRYWRDWSSDVCSSDLMTLASSWSYVEGDTCKPAGQLIHTLIDIVAKGGNFLLNIGPSPEGELPDSAYSRLQEIGDWMKINGEAIYKTRPFPPYKSGKICFTSLRDGTVYLIYLADASEIRMPSFIDLQGFKLPKGQKVRLLGNPGQLKCSEKGDVFRIRVPEATRLHPPCKYAWVFKIS